MKDIWEREKGRKCERKEMEKLIPGEKSARQGFLWAVKNRKEPKLLPALQVENMELFKNSLLKNVEFFSASEEESRQFLEHFKG